MPDASTAKEVSHRARTSGERLPGPRQRRTREAAEARAPANERTAGPRARPDESRARSRQGRLGAPPKVGVALLGFDRAALLLRAEAWRDAAQVRRALLTDG